MVNFFESSNCKYLLLALLVIIFIIIVKLKSNIDNFNQNIIPKTIYLCYKTKDVPSYIISNWKLLNPEYNIIVSDNNDCIKFLKDNYGQKYVDIFNHIKDGPIKADFWRVCILYKYGGVYSDIDIEPLVPIKEFFQKGVSFLSCISMNKNMLNPHFIITHAGHPILKKSIDKYIEYYDTKKKYTYWGWSIVYIMEDVVHDIFKEYYNNDGIYTDKDNNKYQFLKEISTPSVHDIYCKYKGVKILNNRYKKYDPDNHNFDININNKETIFSTSIKSTKKMIMNIFKKIF